MTDREREPSEQWLRIAQMHPITGLDEKVLSGLQYWALG
jgi:hypothetical protein